MRRFRAPRGASSNYKKFGLEPPDHSIGRSRGGLTTKNHLVCDGRGRALAFILTPGQAADTSMLPATLEQIRVPGAAGRPRTRPDRVLADKGYPSKANRAWLRERGIAATIPNATTRSQIVASDRAVRSISAMSSGGDTAAATWSNGASTSSSNGVGSPCVQTRPPGTTTLAFAWPQPSTGSIPVAASRANPVGSEGFRSCALVAGRGTPHRLR